MIIVLIFCFECSVHGLMEIFDFDDGREELSELILIEYF